MAIRKQLLQYVESNPGRSATQIANALGLKASGVSSILNQCVKTEALRRLPGGGPRGGYVYFIVGYKPPAEPYPTRFDRIYFA